MKALPIEIPELDILDLTILNQVAEMAAGMTEAEILATFSFEADKFSKDETIYFNEFYQFGRGMAVNRVVQNLLEQTKGRAGQQAAMSFLRRFASQFEGELEGNDTSGNFSFTFGSGKEA